MAVENQGEVDQALAVARVLSSTVQLAGKFRCFQKSRKSIHSKTVIKMKAELSLVVWW